MTRTVESPQSSDASLPEFLAERARTSSDTRLLVDAIAGLVVAVTFSIWRIPAWYLLAAAGACFLFYGIWAIAGRELAEAPAGAPRRRVILKGLSLVSATAGFAAAAFLVLAVMAKLIGRVIS